jgi:hypothetical protein
VVEALICWCVALDCSAHCTHCSSASMCTQCSSTFGLKNNACSCSQGTFLSGSTCSACATCASTQYISRACTSTANAICAACPAGCLSCTGPLSCQVCVNGTANDGVCCSANQWYSAVSLTCNACSAAGGCPSAYFSTPCTPLANSGCTACSAHCANCSSASSCSVCAPNYILSAQACISGSPVPQQLVLGSATNYAVIAYSTVTNNGPSVITGDLALSPGSAITGAPLVDGATNIDNTAAATAIADAGTAFTAISGFPCSGNNTLTNHELGGLTLAPGTYCWSPAGATSLTGVLTLSGPAGSVWLFQLPLNALTVANGASIVMEGGANFCGVAFVVAGAALGTGTAFQGTIISYAAITVGTSSIVNGRLLSLTAAVTLLSDTIDISECSVGAGSSTGTQLSGAFSVHTSSLIATMCTWVLVVAFASLRL